MPNIVLKCDSICKKIKKREIVSDLSLELYEGDILGFVGPNGAGKTTTIKLILGLESLTSGKVEINGMDTIEDFKEAIREVGAIVENPDMYMYMTGYENLLIVARIYKIDKKRLDEVIELVGLSKRINDKVRKYSLGMRQRLGIAQAILHKPKLLILDEPTNGLDPEGINEMRRLLIKLARDEKMAIIVSSHILSELETFCNKVCIIQNGKVICNTSIDNLRKSKDSIPYMVEVSDTNLDSVLEFYEVVDDKHIRVISNDDKIGNIIKAILLNDINIYEIRKEEKTLEDIFLDYTGGNVIV